MEKNFPTCLQYLLKLEGGFAKLPGDETTKYGVKQSTWEAYCGHPVTEAVMRNLTTDQVGPLYKTHYWDQVRADELPSGVDVCLFDFAVHSGPREASTQIQRIVGVVSDGTLGKLSLAAIASMKPESLITQLIASRLAFIKKLKNYPLFAKGWESRLVQLQGFCQKLSQNE